MIEKIESTILELDETKSLLNDIRELDRKLIQTDSYLDEVRSHISIWDRVNIFSKTNEEEMEEDLREEIGETSEAMSNMLARLDDILLGVARSLVRSDDSVRQYVVWSELHRLSHLISGISVERSPFTSDFAFEYTIKGKQQCMKLANELEELTRLSMEEPMSIGTVLGEVKKKLIENYAISSERNY